MDRCWLKGAVGDALHALSCAAGYNIHWLMRVIARLGLGGLFYACFTVAMYALGVLKRVLAGPVALGSNSSGNCSPHAACPQLRLAASG